MEQPDDLITIIKTRNQANWIYAHNALEKFKQILCSYILQFLEDFITTIGGSETRTLCEICTHTSFTSCPTEGVCIFMKESQTCLSHDNVETTIQTANMCPNNICDKIRTAVKNNYVGLEPHWNNSDIRQWGKSDWEIAKCFLPSRPGHKSPKSISELDFQGILDLTRNAKFIRNKIEVGRSSLDKLLRACIKDTTELLNSRTKSITDLKCKTCIEHIESAIKLMGEISLGCSQVQHNSLNTCKPAENGYALIINIKKFDEKSWNDNPNFIQLENRSGSQIDVNKLKRLFEQLYYKVEVLKDKTSKEMTNLNTSYDHTEFESFVCIILSHGYDGHVFGSDGLPVSIHDIKLQFIAQNCPSLKGKPKIFIINACRRKQIPRNENNEEIKCQCSVCKCCPDSDSHVPDFKNMFVVNANISGHIITRGTSSGSPFVAHLCHTFSDLEDIPKEGICIEDIMRKIIRNLQTDVFIPVPESTLINKIIIGRMSDDVKDKDDEKLQHEKKSNIRFKGIPKYTENLKKVISLILENELSNFEETISFHINDIESVERDYKDVIVKFQTYDKKCLILKHLHHPYEIKETLPFDGKRFAVEPDLTESRLNIARICQTLQMKGIVKRTWIIDGTIFVKTNDENEMSFIREDDERLSQLENDFRKENKS